MSDDLLLCFVTYQRVVSTESDKKIDCKTEVDGHRRNLLSIKLVQPFMGCALGLN